MKKNFTSFNWVRVYGFLLGVGLFLLPRLGWGQAVTISSTASFSNFNTPVLESMTGFVGSSGSASNIPNWQLSGTGTSGNTLSGSTQSTGTAGGWYGNSNISFLGSGNASNGNATLRLRNTTGSTLTGFRVVYNATMWKSNTSASPTVSVTWSNNSAIAIPTAGGLTNTLSSLGFSDATSNISSGVTLSQSVSGQSIANNDYIFLRWIHSGGGNSDNLGWDEVYFVPRPITQASSVTFSSIGTTTMTTGWTNGNGARRVVFIRQGDVGTIGSPVDGTLYTASSNWNSGSPSGTQLGTSGYYCVYDGTGSTVDLTNLTANTAYYVQVFEYNSDASGTAALRTYFTGGTPATGNQTTASNSNSNASNIIRNTNFTEPTNIAYGTYQQTTGLTSGNSLEVAQFDIQDGGGAADADALSTTLTGLTLTVANSSSMRRIALFDGSTNVGEVAAGATATFSSLTLAAADGGSKTFSVRVSFKSTVTDNQQFSFTVSSATASGAGSTFAAANAGAAVSSTTGNSNKIVVTATDLIFNINPSNVAINAVMSPSPTVLAIDANVNTDLDFVGTVTLTTTGTFGGGATTSVSAVSGTATFSNLTFSVSATGLTIAGSATGLNATGNSATFNVFSPPTNDDCSGATSLTIDAAAISGTSLNATQSIAAITCQTATSTGTLADVWYKFTATQASLSITVTPSASYDAVIDVRSGACNGTNINCADGSNAGVAETVNLTGLTTGTDYFIRVYHFGGGSSATPTFTIGIKSSITYAWTGTTNTTWLTTTNWSTSSAPSGAIAEAFFDNNTMAGTVGINMNGISVGNSSIGAIHWGTSAATTRTFNNSSTTATGTFTLNGLTINAIANTIIRNASTGTHTIANGSSQVLTIGLGNSTENIIAIDGTGGITISSIISGSNKLTKAGSGSGILTLTGANTYTGLSTISAGTLKLNKTGGTTIPITNNVTVTGGTLQISSNQTLNNLTVNGGTVTIDNGITLTVNGTLALTSGTITVGSGTLVIAGATVTRTSGSIDASNASATVIFTNTSALSLPASTFTGNVTNLTMNGAGGVTLGSAVTVAGTTTLTSGKLTLGANDLTIGASGSITSANANSYIVTNSTGLLKRSSVSSSSVNFPIGTASEYLPITSFSNSGTTDDFGAKVSASAPSCVSATNSLTATWDITEGTALGSNIALTLQYNNTTAFGGSYTHAQAKLFHCNGATPDQFGPAGAALSGSVYTISHSGFTTFSPFGISNDAVLATELTNLTAKSKNGQNLITWQTVTEKNADHFDIQRATNPQAHWQTIGTVKAAGSSQTIKEYEYVNDAPLSISYYRLRSVDFDGKGSLSNTVSVISSASSKLKVYPTIVQDKLTISLDSNEPQTFHIFNLLGQNVQTGQLNGQKELVINQLSSGTYFLKANGETVKFVKN